MKGHGCFQNILSELQSAVKHDDAHCSGTAMESTQHPCPLKRDQGLFCYLRGWRAMAPPSPCCRGRSIFTVFSRKVCQCVLQEYQLSALFLCMNLTQLDYAFPFLWKSYMILQDERRALSRKLVSLSSFACQANDCGIPAAGMSIAALALC